ncbi:MAG: hydrogenase nickel incorporation protein HypB [Planctomycetes bacterium]|jgi:hydrogenase nickel incorporation protein HypB|nr:hydrogenase nickel incorporation protein HypB [Planctomycetota bacterium]
METTRWVVEVNQALLGKNTELAAQNRLRFHAQKLLVVNIMSGPGSGKTALLERTLSDLCGRVRIGVQVGDLQTDNDARRLSERGAPVVQILTGGCCHLDASMIAQANEKFDLSQLDLLIIENVGNLVCTASYDLGEDLRVVLLSVTEGEDKPLKYPTLFRKADLVLITKTDLAAAVGADLPALRENIHRTAPTATLLELSARSGSGLDSWYDFLWQALKRQIGKAH